MSLLEIRDISKQFDNGSLLRQAGPYALRNVTLNVEQGQTLGIVGESGSGKSTLLRVILRLIRPTSGSVLFEGQDVWSMRGTDLRGMRRKVQAVFQDPASSFNPRQRIGAILRAPLDVHGIGPAHSRDKVVAATLERVGLPADFASRLPHQLSGGQRQRVAIGRAIIMGPSLILADEPTSALDVSVQAQILNLFRETKRSLGLTSIFVSHNLAVVRYLSDHVAVMRHGEVVESGPAETVFRQPKHTYTRALIDAVPDPRRQFHHQSHPVTEVRPDA
jgi:peptide/nickel transport system ATP-binding protein